MNQMNDSKLIVFENVHPAIFILWFAVIHLWINSFKPGVAFLQALCAFMHTPSLSRYYYLWY